MIGVSLTRRGFLGSATASGAWATLPDTGALPPFGPGDHGRVRPPIPLPQIPLTLHDGAVTTLASVVKGRATAIQIMFTACTTTCPVGAATFAQAQGLLGDQALREITLLSLDIAPFGDPPATLAAWLDRLGARPGWIAASPDPAGLRAVQKLFDQGRDFSEPHSDRVHVVNRAGELVWRTQELPSAEDIVGLLTRI